MIRSFLILAGLCCSPFTGHCSPATDSDRLLNAIRQVEEWQGRDGAAGERGPWQITKAVWMQHCPAWGFEKARAQRYARVCAARHLDWLVAGLRRKGIEPVPYTLALAWNAGLTGATNGRAPRRAHDYADRVQALYLALNSQPSTLNSK
jgi:hypothetical protein